MILDEWFVRRHWIAIADRPKPRERSRFVVVAIVQQKTPHVGAVE